MSQPAIVEAPRLVERFSPIADYLDGLVARYCDLDTGSVATYIPELGSVDPSLFGVCLVTTGGAVYESGDTRERFTIQSISKPLTYGMVLERLGEDAVRTRIGVEPSGDAFNEISLAPVTGIPVNPMINAGAIACAGLLAASAPDPMSALLATYSLYAGRPLALDEDVYRSESETGHRNRAIAHLLRNFDVIVDDPEQALDVYFRQCSVSVDCRDLAAIAGTLANGGVNPQAGELVYSDSCSGCHGALGTGGNGGPDISDGMNRTKVIAQVTNGGGGMPAFKGTLDQKQISDVAAYVTDVVGKR